MWSCVFHKIYIVEINKTLHIAIIKIVSNDQDFMFMFACCL